MPVHVLVSAAIKWHAGSTDLKQCSLVVAWLLLLLEFMAGASERTMDLGIDLIRGGKNMGL